MKFIHDKFEVETLYFGDYDYRMIITTWFIWKWCKTVTHISVRKTAALNHPFNFYIDMVDDFEPISDLNTIAGLTALLLNHLQQGSKS